MKLRQTAMMLAAAAGLAVAGAARADLFTATVSGVFTTGADNANIFGLASQGASGLVGQAYTLRVAYDTSLGSFEPDSNELQIFVVGANSPFLSETLRVNGVDHFFGPATAGELMTAPHEFAPTEFAINFADSTTTNDGFSVDYSGAHVPFNFRDPFTDTDGCAHCAGIQLFADGLQTNGQMSVTSFAVAFGVTLPGSPTPGVPEPASWALMMRGFGGLGAALRASRRRAALC
jgi:hypothetical protein